MVELRGFKLLPESGGHWLGPREDPASGETYCSGSFPLGQSTGAASFGGLGDRKGTSEWGRVGEGSVGGGGRCS